MNRHRVQPNATVSSDGVERVPGAQHSGAGFHRVRHARACPEHPVRQWSRLFCGRSWILGTVAENDEASRASASGSRRCLGSSAMSQALASESRFRF